MELRVEKELKNFSENYVKKLQGSESISTIFESAMEVGNFSKRDDNFYHCVSWCKFDLYGADFGWGKMLGPKFTDKFHQSQINF